MNCIFISPFFGRLPESFQLWLNSCGYNREFDFLIITDDLTNYNYPSNVHVNYCSFDYIRKKIQSKFDFLISLNYPFKLCDYRPAYGYIFEEEIKDYDYWGYCDLDIIFGDISQFITEEILKKYEKILLLGHMTLYRNNEEANKRFMIKVHPTIDYQVIFSSNDNYAFDELGSYAINSIYDALNIPIYMQEIYADISCMSRNLYLSHCNYHKKEYNVEKNKQIFSFESGKIYGHVLKDDCISKTEYVYIHMQKRKINIEINQDTTSMFLILPNKITNYEKPSEEIIRQHSKPCPFYLPYFKNKYKALVYRIKELIKNEKK